MIKKNFRIFLITGCASTKPTSSNTTIFNWAFIEVFSLQLHRWERMLQNCLTLQRQESFKNWLLWPVPCLVVDYNKGSIWIQIQIILSWICHKTFVPLFAFIKFDITIRIIVEHSMSTVNLIFWYWYTGNCILETCVYKCNRVYIFGILVLTDKH